MMCLALSAWLCCRRVCGPLLPPPKPNSGDTGGIVYDNWSRLDWHKLSYQMWGLGLTPWYKW